MSFSRGRIGNDLTMSRGTHCAEGLGVIIPRPATHDRDAEGCLIVCPVRCSRSDDAVATRKEPATFWESGYPDLCAPKSLTDI
jgi:hypothetical protein